MFDKTKYEQPQKIILTPQEYEEILKKVFMDGRVEGFNEGFAAAVRADQIKPFDDEPWRSPITYKPDPYNPYKITCDSGMKIDPTKTFTIKMPTLDQEKEIFEQALKSIKKSLEIGRTKNER